MNGLNRQHEKLVRKLEMIHLNRKLRLIMRTLLRIVIFSMVLIGLHDLLRVELVDILVWNLFYLNVVR